ncbi:uncharacterized protein [Primulina eburnea]|uniref:uncharacterized protein n=1 Tax=Primulina eburnea TaxID=1245227 RepID=UPI003C6C3933
MEERLSDVKLKLIGRRCGDGRRYNLPSASEVAALIVRDFDEPLGDRDILVETQMGKLKCINQLNPAYLALHYPLIFPYGEDGYREDISFSESKSNSVGIKKLRFEMYKDLHDALLRSETNPSTQGKRTILPSTFTGGARYMIQNYQDAMAICKWVGYPDLFMTFTCNTKWPEIVRFVEELRGATCYDDISIFNGVQCHSFRDACYALGLLNDDKEYIDGIVEASHWTSTQSLRVLFATLSSSDSTRQLEVVWESCWTYLSDDILYKQRNLLHHQELELNEDKIKSHGLVEIEKLLRSYGKSLRGFQSMPFPSDEYFQSSRNSLIHDEMWFDRRVLFREYHNLLNNLNDQKRQIYNSIMTVVDFEYERDSLCIWIWRYWKNIFLENSVCMLEIKWRNCFERIAYLLHPGGRTAHSCFSIPFNPTEESTCNIKQGSPPAELIVKSKLIIWGEAPMTHKFCFEALDKIMKDIIRFVNPSSLHMPFGGKTVVFGDDFRQILPNLGSDEEYAEMKKISDWIANLGDGKIEKANDGYATIDIPD